MNNNITWIIHYVHGEEGDVSFHTHGLTEYGSLEIETTLHFKPEDGQYFLNLIGLEIANGKTFKDNDIDNTIFNYGIAFKETKGLFTDDDSPKVLRVIFQDPNHKFPWDEGCLEEYKKQI